MRHSLPIAAVTLGLLLAIRATHAANTKGTQWLINYNVAMTEARAHNRVVLAYFSGSDWDPWCQKLDEEVLETQAFRDWAAKNVILLRLDFPREKRISSTISQQNEQLKADLSVSKTPTFVFLDPWGQPFARAGYDEAKLRKGEPPRQPKAWLEYLERSIKARPPEVPIAAEADFNSAVAKAKSKYGVLVMLITHGQGKAALHERDQLLRDQKFVKFINANVTFVSIAWPEDSDNSAAAQSFRAFATAQKLSQSPFQLLVYDSPYNKILARIFTYDPNHIESLIFRIQSQLPHIDYSGGWLTDYDLAKTIAAQSDRYIFLAFTETDGQWSKRMDQEIFQSSEFRQYARKQLVLVRIDFSPSPALPAATAAQNKTLADLFNIRGFPTIVVVNPLGQKLVESKYVKGGPKIFLSELDPLIQSDIYRRKALKD